MTKSPFSIIDACKVLPMFGPCVKADYAKVATILSESNLPIAEVLFRGPGAEQVITQLKEAMPSLSIGAGTILTREQVDVAVSAGADFIISPGLNPDVVKYCQDKAVPILPGVCSPSDIERGLALGLTRFKFFPAEQYGGVATLKALAAPYNMVKFLPTGGITLSNIGQYLALPAVFACGGSWMVAPELLEQQKYDDISNRLGSAYQQTRNLGGVA